MDNQLIEELQWRGMIHNIMPGTAEQLSKEVTTGYIGFDPTSDSLHVGSLIPILLLVHFQKHGHKPIALVGGATGMVGDPSEKTDERNLLDEKTLQKNIDGIKAQLSKFLDFEKEGNPALLLNNYDWMKDFSFINFIRDVGKHITVNYMMAKDSVKKRIETGISFTEFSYQLLQGYDFYHLNKELNCKVQMGGSDQWGNITTGTELVRRIGKSEGWAFTCPLMTKSDGGKFGKSESGTVWLDPKKTSPYEFYQFWLNASDEDALKFIKTFTLLDRPTIEKLNEEHLQAPHLRVLQKELAKEITTLVHSKNEYNKAVTASNILFGKSSSEDLKNLDESTFKAVFNGVPQAQIKAQRINNGISIIEALADSGFLKSNGEARRELKANSISVNKDKVNETKEITNNDLINNKFIVLQKGKKKYFILEKI